MWIDTGLDKLPAGFEKALEELGLPREDRTDAVWMDLSSGAQLILACIGGWRASARSYYLLFYVSPSGVLADITFAVLGTSTVNFDRDAEGANSYRDIRKLAVAAVSARVGAKRLWEIPIS